MVDNTPKLNYFMVGPGIKGSLGNEWHHVHGWPTTSTQRWYDLLPACCLLRLGEVDLSNLHN